MVEVELIVKEGFNANLAHINVTVTMRVIVNQSALRIADSSVNPKDGDNYVNHYYMALSFSVKRVEPLVQN